MFVASKTQIVGNTARKSGIGGLSLHGENVLLINGLVRDNAAMGRRCSTCLPATGGIRSSGPLLLTRTQVIHNNADADGHGGIWSIASPVDPTLVKSRATHNQPDNCFGFTAPGCAP